MNNCSQRKNKTSGPRRVSEGERYFWLAFTLALLVNRVLCLIARLLTRGKHHYDLSLPIDASIPFLPWTVCIYTLGCFTFWFFLYRRIAALPRQKADRFFCANLLGKVICFLFFVFFPTAITRPEVNGAGFWDACLRLLYRADQPVNLFPSLHCFIAWLGWAGVRRNKEVSPGWRVSALLTALAVFISTLTIRQHVILDVMGGIALSELCWLLAGCDGLRRMYSSLMDRILFGRKREHGASTSR